MRHWYIVLFSAENKQSYITVKPKNSIEHTVPQLKTSISKQAKQGSRVI